jgi:hypothetical protein
MQGYESKYPKYLAKKFPRIVRKVVSLWNSPDSMTSYFQELLVADSPTRQGFPPLIASEIFSLSQAYDQIQQTKQEACDVWENEAREITAELDKLGVSLTPRALLKASEMKNREVVTLLLRTGISPDIRDEKEWTPLMIASFEGNEEIALILIQHGAKTDARDRDGYGPLHWAAVGGFESVVKLLLSKGADSNMRSGHGVTPLILAAAKGYLSVVKALLAAGGHPNEPTDEGWTALHKAIANGHTAVVETLLDGGGNLLASHASGMTPLVMAQKCKYPEIRQSIKQWATKVAASKSSDHQASKSAF